MITKNIKRYNLHAYIKFRIIICNLFKVFGRQLMYVETRQPIYEGLNKYIDT